MTGTHLKGGPPSPAGSKQNIVFSTLIGTGIDVTSNYIELRDIRHRLYRHLEGSELDPRLDEIITTNSDYYAHSGQGMGASALENLEVWKNKVVTAAADAYSEYIEPMVTLLSFGTAEGRKDIGLSINRRLHEDPDPFGLSLIARESYVGDPTYQKAKLASSILIHAAGETVIIATTGAFFGGLGAGLNYTWKGGEVVASSYRWTVFRVAPFGHGRTPDMISRGISNPISRRLPHYHRRRFDEFGRILEGQGISRHRPLEGGF